LILIIPENILGAHLDREPTRRFYIKAQGLIAFKRSFAR